MVPDFRKRNSIEKNRLRQNRNRVGHVIFDCDFSRRDQQGRRIAITLPSSPLRYWRCLGVGRIRCPLMAFSLITVIPSSWAYSDAPRSASLFGRWSAIVEHIQHIRVSFMQLTSTYSLTCFERCAPGLMLSWKCQTRHRLWMEQTGPEDDVKFRQMYRLSRQQAQMVHNETEDLPRKRTNAMRAVSMRHMALIALRSLWMAFEDC